MRELPEGWEEKELEKLVDFEKKSKRKAGDGKKEGRYNFFTSSPIQSMYIDEYDYEGEHIIFGTGGSASVHYCNDKFSTTADCIVVKVKDDMKDGVSTKFIYYYLLYRLDILERGFRGAGLKHISKNYLKKVPVLTTSDIDQQKRIVEMLDEADKLVQLRQEADMLTDEYLRSVFYEMFGDPFKNTKDFDFITLKDYCETIQIGPFGSQLHKSDYVENGVPIINPTHIIDRKISVNPNFSITSEKYKALPNYHLKAGDVIMGRRGEMGRCALVTEKETGWFCGTGSLFIRLKKELNPVFILYLLSGSSSVKYLENEAKGVTMKNLSKKVIENIKFGYPSIDIQNQFAEIVREVEELREYQKKSGEKINDFFQSILQKAFRGELV